MRRLALILAILAFTARTALAGTITRGTKSDGGGTDWAVGATLTAGELNDDFNKIVTEFNGSIETGNISNTTILNEDISASAVSQRAGREGLDLIVQASQYLRSVR